MCRTCGETTEQQCKCGATMCPRHAHYYVDESNRAITASALPQCPVCADVKLSRPYKEYQAIEALEW